MSAMRVTEIKNQLKDAGFVKNLTDGWSPGITELMFVHENGQLKMVVYVSRQSVDVMTSPTAEYGTAAYREQKKMTGHLPYTSFIADSTTQDRIIELICFYRDMFAK